MSSQWPSMDASGSWFPFLLDNTPWENWGSQREPQTPWNHHILHIRIKVSRQKDTPCNCELTSEGNTSCPPGGHAQSDPCVCWLSSHKERKHQNHAWGTENQRQKLLQRLHLPSSGLSLGVGEHDIEQKRNGYRHLEKAVPFGDGLTTMSLRQC